jgi:hypothetical protein
VANEATPGESGPHSRTPDVSSGPGERIARCRRTSAISTTQQRRLDVGSQRRGRFGGSSPTGRRNPLDDVMDTEKAADRSS